MKRELAFLIESFTVINHMLLEERADPTTFDLSRRVHCFETSYNDRKTLFDLLVNLEECDTAYLIMWEACSMAKHFSKYLFQCASMSDSINKVLAAAIEYHPNEALSDMDVQLIFVFAQILFLKFKKREDILMTVPIKGENHCYYFYIKIN